MVTTALDSIQASVHVEYVQTVDKQLMEEFGFVEIEPNVYYTTFKTYSNNGEFIETSDLYIIVRNCYVWLENKRCLNGTLQFS